MNPKLGPRFWSDPGTYDWASKYRREIKGVHNLLQNFQDLNNPLSRNTIIEIIQQHRIKSLLAKKTIKRVIKLTGQKNITTEQKIAANQPTRTIETENTQFVDTEPITNLGKIRKREKHG